MISSSNRLRKNKDYEIGEQKIELLPDPNQKSSKTDKLAIIYYLFIIFGMAASIFAMFTMHYFSGFDTDAEKLAIDEKIRYIFNMKTG